MHSSCFKAYYDHQNSSCQFCYKQAPLQQTQNYALNNIDAFLSLEQPGEANPDEEQSILTTLQNKLKPQNRPTFEQMMCLEQQKRSLYEFILTLEKNYLILQKEYTSLSKERKTVIERNQIYQKQIIKLEHYTRELERESQQKGEEMRKYQQKSEEIQSNLREEFMVLRREIEQLKGENSQLQVHVQRLSNYHRRQSDDLSSHQVERDRGIDRERNGKVHNQGRKCIIADLNLKEEIQSEINALKMQLFEKFHTTRKEEIFQSRLKGFQKNQKNTVNGNVILDVNLNGNRAEIGSNESGPNHNGISSISPIYDLKANDFKAIALSEGPKKNKNKSMNKKDIMIAESKLWKDVNSDGLIDNCFDAVNYQIGIKRKTKSTIKLTTNNQNKSRQSEKRKESQTLFRGSNEGDDKENISQSANVLNISQVTQDKHRNSSFNRGQSTRVTRLRTKSSFGN